MSDTGKLKFFLYCDHFLISKRWYVHMKCAFAPQFSSHSENRENLSANWTHFLLCTRFILAPFSSVLFLFINHGSCLDPELATVQRWDGFAQLITSQTLPNTSCSRRSPADICISTDTHTLAHTHSARTLSNEVLVLQSPSSIYI